VSRANAHEAIRNLLGRITDPKGRAIAAGQDEITGLWKAMVRVYDGSPRTRHLVSGPIIEVEGERATCRSSFVVLQTFVDGSLNTIAAGRYRDTFAIHNDLWCFTERQFFLDQEGDMSQHMRDL
jgi:3-phenylpropionate/cinnamic acid dioxygenase small subunit